jgi:hypothetical protein
MTAALTTTPAPVPGVNNPSFELPAVTGVSQAVPAAWQAANGRVMQVTGLFPVSSGNLVAPGDAQQALYVVGTGSSQVIRQALANVVLNTSKDVTVTVAVGFLAGFARPPTIELQIQASNIKLADTVFQSLSGVDGGWVDVSVTLLGSIVGSFGGFQPSLAILLNPTSVQSVYLDNVRVVVSDAASKSVFVWLSSLVCARLIRKTAVFDISRHDVQVPPPQPLVALVDLPLLRAGQRHSSTQVRVTIHDVW